MAQAFPAECEVSISIVIIFKVPLLYKQIDIKKKKLKRKFFLRIKPIKGNYLNYSISHL